MNSRIFKIVALAGCLFMAVFAGSAPQAAKQEQAQPPSNPTYKVSVRSNMVLVPVIVTDKEGKHVTGLKPEDFEVKEEGEVQKISSFDENNAESAKVQVPNAAPNSFTNELIAEHPKKMVIMALDRINTPFSGGVYANKGMVEFLAKSFDANTLVALVALEPNGIRLIHNFTSDPSVLGTAVSKLKTSITTRDTLTLNNNGENSEADNEVAQIVALMNAPVSINSPADLRAASQAMKAKADASRASQSALVTLECMQQIAQYFGGVPGRKSLIWASEAFPFSLGSQPGELTRGTLYDDWERTFRMLDDANVAVYPVDVTGLTPGPGANSIQSINSAAVKAGGAEGGVGARSAQLAQVENGSFVDPSVGRHQTMRFLADTTGGQPFYNSNNLSELFRRAADDAGQYYTLGYHTKETGKTGWRKLSVKVKRDDVKVRSRPGYFFTKSGGDDEPVRQTQELMAMQSDLAFTSVPIRGQWQKIEPAGDQRKVHFLLSVPAGVPMIDADHNNHISLDFRAFVMDASGQAVAKIGQRFETNLNPEGMAEIQGQGLDYANALTLPPGQYKAHFVVRDNLRGTMGSVVASLKVD
jgi:VWFA-related protein